MIRKSLTPILIFYLSTGFMGCATFDDIFSHSIPALEVSKDLFPIQAKEEHPIIDYFYPPPNIENALQAGKINQRTIDRCTAGEDVRALFPGQWGVVEVQPGSVTVSGQKVLEFHGWQYPIHPSNPFQNEDLFFAFSQLTKSKKQAKKEDLVCWGDFEGKLLLAVHPDAPIELLKMVMFQAGQAQYADMVFMVKDSSRSPQKKKKQRASTSPKENSQNRRAISPASDHALPKEGSEACAQAPEIHFPEELGILECRNHIGIQVHDKNRLSIYRFESTEEELKNNSKAVHAIIPP